MESIPAALEAVAETRLRENQTYGLAVCGFDRDGTRFAGGVGYADLARSEAATSHTIFRVASISKLLTTTLVLRGVESGRLDLDVPVNDYLPGHLQVLDQTGDPATSSLRSLLSHSSGLGYGVRGADLGNPALSLLANGGRVRDLADAIAGLNLTHGPGERVVYSNPAFNVAGYIAGKAFAAPFEAAMTEHVLTPLGMTRSDFVPTDTRTGVATPYGTLLPPKVSAKPADRMRLVATPMGGLSTTVTDLARFGRMILNGGEVDGGRWLDPTIVTDATSIDARNHPDLEQGYGLGFKVRPWRGRVLVGHDGNMPGVSTQLILSPRDGVGVAVLTNGFALGVPHQIAELALEHLLDASPEGNSRSPVDETRSDRGSPVRRGEQIAGSYRLADAGPPGLVGRLADRLIKIRVSHEADGRLRVDGNPGAGGPMWLLPEGEPDHYRIAAAVDDGTNAVVDERPDGIHIWHGFTTHLQRI